MLNKPLDPMKTQLVFKQIQKDMAVYDSEGKKFGRVKDFYFGASSDEMQRHGAGAATAPDPSVTHDNLVTVVAAVVFSGADDLPEEMRQRLINEGFIRINTDGLFSSDRFALADEIESVNADGVHLNVPKDGLLKKS
jgi:hypothetical protein